MATSGDLSWPPVDTFSWPRTIHVATWLRVTEVDQHAGFYCEVVEISDLITSIHVTSRASSPRSVFMPFLDTVHGHRDGEVRELPAYIDASRKVWEQTRYQRTTSLGRVRAQHLQFDCDDANKLLMYMCAASILELAVTVYV